MNKHTIVVLENAANTDNHYLNNTAIMSEDIDNGRLITLGELSADSFQKDVFEAAIADDEALTGVCIAYSPEIPLVEGYNLDLKDNGMFFNRAEVPFGAKQMVAGEQYKITEDGFTGTPASYVKAGDADGKFVFTATAPTTGFCAKIIDNEPFKQAGKYGTDDIPAYRLKVVAN